MNGLARSTRRTRWALLTGAGAVLCLTLELGLAPTQAMAFAGSASAVAPGSASILRGRADATTPPTPASGAGKADATPSGVAETSPGQTSPPDPEGSATDTVTTRPSVGSKSTVGTPTPTPTPPVATPSTLPTPSDTDGSSSTTGPVVGPTSVIRPETPAIRSTQSVSVRSLVIALVVLLLAGLTLLRLTRRHSAATTSPTRCCS